MTYEMNNLENEVCVQPWCNPLWLTGLEAPTNERTNLPCSSHSLSLSLSPHPYNAGSVGFEANTESMGSLYQSLDSIVCWTPWLANFFSSSVLYNPSRLQSPDTVCETWIGQDDFVPPFKALIPFLTQSCDSISRYGKPVEQINEIISRPVWLIHSTGFLQQLIWSHDWVRDWIVVFTHNCLTLSPPLLRPMI